MRRIAFSNNSTSAHAQSMSTTPAATPADDATAMADNPTLASLSDADRALHHSRMSLALAEADAALAEDEVPVGCAIVLASSGRVLATGRNQTNQTKNVGAPRIAAYCSAAQAAAQVSLASPPLTLASTCHLLVCQLAGHSSLRVCGAGADLCGAATPRAGLRRRANGRSVEWSGVAARESAIEEDSVLCRGSSPAIAASLRVDCVLYVTVEPCIMCASALRLARIGQ